MKSRIQNANFHIDVHNRLAHSKLEESAMFPPAIANAIARLKNLVFIFYALITD
jgi:hypothetical protein